MTESVKEKAGSSTGDPDGVCPFEWKKGAEKQPSLLDSECPPKLLLSETS